VQFGEKSGADDNRPKVDFSGVEGRSTLQQIITMTREKGSGDNKNINRGYKK
jgi:hypothetical protein